MANLFSPQILIFETPGIVCNLSFKTLLAYSLRNNKSLLELCTVTVIILEEPASDLLTIGGSVSAGNERCAWETLSRTSFAAASRSKPTSNSTVMLLRPCVLTLDRERIPEIPLILSSRGSVICDSITSALAPV